MQDFDFANAQPNEILDDLIAATQWLAKQFRQGIPHLPQPMLVKAFSGDAQAKLFFEAGSQHLINLAVSAGSLKTAPGDQGALDHQLVEIPDAGFVARFVAALPGDQDLVADDEAGQ